MMMFTTNKLDEIKMSKATEILDLFESTIAAYFITPNGEMILSDVQRCLEGLPCWETEFQVCSL